MEKKEAKTISLTHTTTEIMKITIEAIKECTLISHRLDGKAVDGFMARETGKPKEKELRDFDKEYETCFYYTEDHKYGFPASAFYSAILNAATDLTLHKTVIKRSIRILGDVLPLTYNNLRRRIDNPRRSGRNGTPDTRHRPEFVDWSCDIYVQYVPRLMSPEQIVSLFNYAGFSTGIGDWRPGSPKSSGTHGMFRVRGDTNVE